MSGHAGEGESMSDEEHARCLMAANDAICHAATDTNWGKWRLRVASIIASERADAWLAGRDVGLDAAKSAFDSILAAERADARRQALEEACAVVDDEYRIYRASASAEDFSRRIRALKDKP